MLQPILGICSSGPFCVWPIIFMAKYYVVKNVLEKFTSKVGQFVEIMDLEEFGNALFIDHEIQVSEKDEKKYSGKFLNSINPKIGTCHTTPTKVPN